MSGKETGGPAFPTENEMQTGPGSYHYEGMTLRDYFAGQALAGLCSAQNVAGVWQGNVPEAAREAYKMADAMLAEKSKP